MKVITQCVKMMGVQAWLAQPLENLLLFLVGAHVLMQVYTYSEW